MPQKDTPDAIKDYRLRPIKKGEKVECIHCGEQTEIQYGALNVNFYPSCDNCGEIIGVPEVKKKLPKIAVKFGR